MKKTFLAVLLLLIICLLGQSCRKCKEEPTPRPSEDANGFLNELPPATTTGEGTMGCLINGEVWLPRFEGTSLGWYDIDFSISENGTFNLFAYRQVHNEKETSGLTINGSTILEEGEYENVNSNFSVTFATSDPAQGYILSCDSIYNLTISNLDYENQIISGSFSAVLVQTEQPFDTLHITEGRFDLSGS